MAPLARSTSPDSDDDFWPIKQIVEESARRFKVEWVGVDPATGTPWAPSWVPKADCTDAAVTKWRNSKIKSKPEEEGHRKSGAIDPDGKNQANRKPKRGWHSDDSLDGSEEPQDLAKTVHVRPSKKKKHTLPTVTQSVSMKVGPPRGARREKPEAKRTSIHPSSPAPAPCVVQKEKPKPEPISAGPVQPHRSSLVSAPCSGHQERAGLVFSDYSPPLSVDLAPNPCEIPQADQRLGELHEQKTEAEQPIPNPDPPSFVAIATNAIKIAAEADGHQQELSSISKPACIPDLPWLVAKVEEIKRLQCEISINSNAALKLGMEVITAVQADSLG